MAFSIQRILKEQPLEASAPCRIDSGGTWDIKTLALPLEKEEPITVNMALNLRTKVTLLPFEDGRVRISSAGFAGKEEAPFETLPFHSPFGLFFAAVSHFGFHGVEVRIQSDSPVKSALGGSSTALVALIKALDKVPWKSGRRSLALGEILHLGFHIEDAVSPGKCGVQDQAAAVYGGVNRWRWLYGDRRKPFQRESLVPQRDLKRLSRHILVAFSGVSHVSSRINQGWIKDFISGTTRSGWVEVNRIVAKFAQALREKDWDGAAGFLQEEMAIRKEMTPGALIPLTEKLITTAEEMGCGARFTGAGGGGSVWAMGRPEKIDRLRGLWEGTLESVKGARVLDCVLDSGGVR